MVGGIVSLGRKMGLDALAEGVETPEEQATLVELGCTYVQGFGLARPMALSDTFAWLETQGAGMPRTEAGRHHPAGGMTPRTAIARGCRLAVPDPAGKVPTTPKTPLDLYPPLLLTLLTSDTRTRGHHGRPESQSDPGHRAQHGGHSHLVRVVPPRPRFPRIPTPSPPKPPSPPIRATARISP